jgi:hypothetical protein
VDFEKLAQPPSPQLEECKKEEGMSTMNHSRRSSTTTSLPPPLEDPLEDGEINRMQQGDYCPSPSSKSGRTTPQSNLHTPSPAASLADPYTEFLRHTIASYSPFADRLKLYKSKELELVGEGTFGKVYKARDPDGNIVAIKKIKFQLAEHFHAQTYGFPLNLLRELCLLQRIRHDCLLPLLDVFPDDNMVVQYSSGGQAAFWMVFPFMDHDLAGLVDACREKTGKPFTDRQAKYYMKKILEGILYLHKNRIMHRDLSKFELRFGLCD